jgi:calpain-15
MSTKEQRIHEGIMLYTQTLSPREIQMSVLNEMLKILTFTIDLTGSTGIIIKESQSLTNTVDIDPRSRVVVATLILEEKWKLSTKFRFTSKPVDPQVARDAIKREDKKITRKIKKAQEILRKVDFNTFDPRSIVDTLGSFIDPYFPPVDSSINLGTDRRIDAIIQWRRPEEFFKGDYKVFDVIEPNDIKQGKLGDCWFMCALASLAERPELVQRLFITKEKNEEGFYQVKFCKSGEWVRVTVDDYFPCFPQDTPIFSRSHGKELWVLLLEKAYAKLHGSYALLRGGWAAEGMMDLTGCPTLNIDFTTAEGKAMIESGELWDKIKKYDEIGALISASTAGEDRFTESAAPLKKGGLVPGHAYTVIVAREAQGNRLLNIRNPWGQFEWDGDWSDKSPLWTEEMKSEIRPVLDENDGTFWISYEDFTKQFSGINICRVDCYQEARIKGTFERTEIAGESWVVSKSYFVVQSKRNTSITVGLHQEDARNYGVDERRPYLDLGLVVLDMTDGGFKLCKAKEAVSERQVELDIDLEPDKMYLIWPRTSGCCLARPEGARPEVFKWFENEELHPLFESTIIDLFRKANKSLGEDLTYIEFSSIMQKVGETYSEEEFADLVHRLPSHEDGLTQEGLIEFFREKCSAVGEETIKRWFHTWGYDRDLYSIQSRYYVMTFHSQQRLKIQMKSSAGLNMNERIHEMLLQKSGEKKGVTDNVQLYCLMERAANAFMYGAFNDNNYKVRVTFDCSQSEGLCFSSGKNLMVFEIEAKQWRLITHCQISRNAQGCKLRPVLRVARA